MKKAALLSSNCTLYIIVSLCVCLLLQYLLQSRSRWAKWRTSSQTTKLTRCTRVSIFEQFPFLYDVHDPQFATNLAGNLAGQTWQDYCRRMQAPTWFGREVEMLALSDALQVSSLRNTCSRERKCACTDTHWHAEDGQGTQACTRASFYLN